MLRSILTLTLCLIVTCACAFDFSTSQVIEQLDQTLTQRPAYQLAKEQNIDRLRDLYLRADASARVRLANELCREYWSFNTDSSRYYAQHWVQLASDPAIGNDADLQLAKICLSRCQAVNGLYEEAKQMLLPLEEQLYDSNRNSYWNAKCEVYVWEAQFSPLPDAFDKIRPISQACHDSILASPDLQPELRIHVTALLSDDWNARIAMLLPVLDTLSIDNPNLRYLANNMADCYNFSGRPDSAIYYYALSAISDLKQSVREYASLSSLALLLYRQGDVDRAYRYITTSLEDSELCGAQMRTVSMARFLPIIIQAYHERVSSQHRWLMFGLGSLVLLLLIILFVLNRFARARRRLKDTHHKLLHYQDDLKQSKLQVEQAFVQLRKANEKLQASNKSLHESNLIKQTYVASYMKQCSATLAKIENYRLMLQKTALTSNYGKLVSTIKDTQIIDSELEDFYRGFDETFLSLFPTFITDFNALLRPEEQLAVPAKNRLSTELRIFALIRLGFDDIDEIAGFLRYSVKTIYNYRTRIRNKALRGGRDLEENLMKIGTELL